MKKGMNKKAQDLSIGTLILIVLGIVVLVLLVLGFSMGWSNLWEKINVFGGGSSLGDVATACNLAATQGSGGTYAYCQEFKQIKIDGKKQYLNCQDDRLAPSITTKLNCPAEYGDKIKSATKYCETLKTGADFSEETLVNGVSCPSLGVTKEATEANSAASADG